MPTIALVDDDRNILTSVSIALESEGYRVQTYTDGASALDGFQSSAARSRHPRHQDAAHGRHGAAAPPPPEDRLPVIFLTSKDEEIDELFGLKMGADDFIRKPFSQRLLVERVKAVLRRFAPREPAPTREADAKASRARPAQDGSGAPCLHVEASRSR